MGAALGQRVGGFATFGEFGAVVCCYAVYDDQADVEALDGDRDLVAEDVLLSFEVVDSGALDPCEGGLLGG